MKHKLTLRFEVRPRKDLKEATKTQAEGGSGIAKDFWEWNEEQVRPFL